MEILHVRLCPSSEFEYSMDIVVLYHHAQMLKVDVPNSGTFLIGPTSIKIRDTKLV